MKKIIILVFTFISFLTFGQAIKSKFKMVGDIQVYRIDKDNILVFSSGMTIDADGAPHAYHSDENKGLDYLANGGHSGNWWALVTDNKKNNGNPLIQSASDPAPGFYISKTSLEDKTKRYEDPNRYVNSETIPYIALPSNLSNNLKLGDIVLVVNKANNKKYFAIYADWGPKNKLGEGSMYLAKQLGINSSPKNGGTNSSIFYILLEKSGNGKILSDSEIQEIGKRKLTESEISELIK